MTPVSTIVAALNKILDDESLSGQALECSVEKIMLTPEPEYLNGEASKRSCFVYEAGFQHFHGEPSGLPDSA